LAGLTIGGLVLWCFNGVEVQIGEAIRTKQDAQFWRAA
jgi:hypothetical protein